MFKIDFWLKKSDSDKGALEYVTIADPRVVKFENDAWEIRYICEVYLSDINYNYPGIYGINPIDTAKLALEVVKIYFQGLVIGGSIISYVENRKPWILEKGKSLQEHVNEVKNNNSISADDKQKILTILKESFGKSPSPIKEQINKLI